MKTGAEGARFFNYKKSDIFILRHKSCPLSADSVEKVGLHKTLEY
jgi:hypothetical protein